MRTLTALSILLAAAASRADDTITGTVTDAQGSPVAGAVVEWNDPLDAAAPRDRAVTDDAGSYTLNLTVPDPGFRVSVHAEGFGPAWLENSTAWDLRQPLPRPPARADFVLQPARTLTGVVLDEVGRAIPSVTVQALTPSVGVYSSFASPTTPSDLPGDPARYQAVTDADGRFTIVGLPEQVTLRVATPHRHVNDANYPTGEPARIVMRGSGLPGRLAVVVTDADTGSPLPGCTVVQRYRPTPVAVTDHDGRGAWSDDLTAENAYQLLLYAEGYAPWRGKVKATALDGDDVAAIALTRAPSLRGRVVRADTGEPVAHARLLLGDTGKARYFEWPDWDRYVDGRHNLTWVQHSTSDDDGAFWWAEPDDAPLTVYVLAPGCERLALKPTDRPAPGADGRIPIALRPEAVITGTLVDDDGKPLTGRRLTLWRQPIGDTPEDFFEPAATDDAGRFAFHNLGPGSYFVGVDQQRSRHVHQSLRLDTVTLEPAQHADLGTRVPPNAE